ncbi:unnamed protein product [Caenorhabditis bovis]|uniref:Uncharacterized protein n=1 Tax=Caenorhabditis bovis TaxID=2654633 RepID=A0A8S1EME9_9PELO|nr:unnamed protein product [Caenorhabditis bovis]
MLDETYYRNLLRGRIRLAYLSFTMVSFLSSIGYLIWSIDWIKHTTNCGRSGIFISYFAIVATVFYAGLATIGLFLFRRPTRILSRILIGFATSSSIFVIGMILIMIISMIASFEPYCLRDKNTFDAIYIIILTGITCTIHVSLLVFAIMVRYPASSHLPTYREAISATGANRMTERKPIVLKATGTAAWKLRIYSILRYPMTRTGPAVTAAVAIYLIAFNVGMRLWKGDEHPLNRFVWRIREQEGSLNPELLYKKKIVQDYHYSRIFDAKDDPPHLGY